MKEWMGMSEGPGELSDPGPGGRQVLFHLRSQQHPPLWPQPGSQSLLLTFLLGLVLLYPVGHVPQGVKEEVSLLLADDLGQVERRGQAGRCAGGQVSHQGSVTPLTVCLCTPAGAGPVQVGDPHLL